MRSPSNCSVRRGRPCRRPRPTRHEGTTNTTAVVWPIDTPAARFEAFPPAEAKRLSDRLELHYPPKHGSWLNSAQIELSVLSRQCLAGRVPNSASPTDSLLVPSICHTP
jgi:hypothetical protein